MTGTEPDFSAEGVRYQTGFSYGHRPKFPSMPGKATYRKDGLPITVEIDFLVGKWLIQFQSGLKAKKEIFYSINCVLIRCC
jgi:hypothetical protein